MNAPSFKVEELKVSQCKPTHKHQTDDLLSQKTGVNYHKKLSTICAVQQNQKYICIHVQKLHFVSSDIHRQKVRRFVQLTL